MATSMHLLMHATAIKKHGTVADIAAISGLDQARAEQDLATAETMGRVMSVDGKYVLTPAGQMIVLAEYSRFCEPLRNDAAFVQAYEQFEVINRDLKALITRWQTREIGGQQVANDHSDKAYDENVIGQLGDLHERFEPVLQKLLAGQSRLGIYRSKLEQALEKAEDGHINWVSDARTESYHTVWFELHEDLLRLLGQEREE